MNKLTIPAILVATVMVAGMFAFMPVQQASTVHTTTGGFLSLAPAATVNPTVAATDAAIWTIGEPFCVKSIYRTGGADAGALNVGVFTVATNLVAAADYPLVVDDAAGAASTAVADLLAREAAGIADVPLCGTTTLTVTSSSTAGVAGDTNIITALIETQGSTTIAAAALG